MNSIKDRLRKLWNRWNLWRFPGSATYWQRRYVGGRTSGAGSYGENAAAKAREVNRIIEERDVASVVEFGCGDGNQLAHLEVDRYIGLDVAAAAIEHCADRFSGDDTKSFFWFSPEHFVDRAGVIRADAALSQEVIFHLVEDEVFERYMRQLFGAAERLVMIWSSDRDLALAPQERHRNFTPWVTSELPEWELVEHVPSPRPWSNENPEGLMSDFFCYRRRNQV